MPFQRLVLAAAVGLPLLAAPALAADPVKYARYSDGGATAYGIVEGDVIHKLSGSPFEEPERTGQRISVDDVDLLPPTDASKVFAVGMNFASHFASAPDAPPPLFLKLPTSLTGHQADIMVPPDAQNLHFEGELVIVIGERAKEVSVDDASHYIFGVTAGNDLTERSWQGRDLQWMRAKASDGFGPVGPYLVTGLDPNNLLLTTRLNDEIVQQESTANMIHSPARVVSYLSHYFTLEPGDLIFMGTPGRTRALADGDVVTVTVDGVGTLSNRIRWPEAQ
ncbi:MAG: fumarylacetoacetate hydrolase family protein [Hyphomicrobiales bacterium]|nr:fumarylacetoacetate hydrolase family protein [Hyphomicrobiales bacterium]